MRIEQLAIAVVFALACVQPASAIMVRETCINGTHELLEYAYELGVNGALDNFTYSQVHNCSMGCFNTRCAGLSPESDTSAMWIVYAGGTVFLILGTVLGIPFGKLVGKENIGGKFDTTMVVRYMFFFVGFYLTYMAFGMARGLEHAYGGATNMAGGMDTATMVMMITMALFLLIFVIETFFTVVQFLGNANEKGRFENE